MSKFAILRSRLDKAETIRRQYEAIWKDITYYVAPNRSNFISTNSNHYASKVVPNIYNTTAIQAAEMLAATLYSGLTNDSTKWFSLKVKDLELQNVDSVKRFLETASNKMLEIFTSPESGFSQQNHELLLDLVTYGTGCIFLEESEKDVIKFSSRHLNEIYIVEDYTGIVDTVFRKFNLTARQLKQQFGDVVDNIPLIKGALESDPDREVEIVHAIYPNSDYSDSGKAKGRFKYNSCYLMGDMETVIMEGHFYELPYLVPRWAKRVGEIYGRSPAWNAIADIKSVNTMEETMLKASQKRVNPPLLVADDGVLQPVRTYPNALIYGGLDSTNYQARIQPLNMVGDLSINESMIEKKNKSIRDIFYIDQLVFRDGPQMTATEVLQRQEESLRLIGPQVSRIQSEYLSPLINRVFSIMIRRNMLGEIPQELKGINIDIDYKNPLHRLQKMESVNAIGRTLQAVVPFLQIDPSIMDVFNPSKTVRYVADTMGVPLELVRSEQEVATMQQQKQAAMQMQQQMEMLKTGSEAGKNIGSMMSDLQGQ